MPFKNLSTNKDSKVLDFKASDLERGMKPDFHPESPKFQEIG